MENTSQNYYPNGFQNKCSLTKDYMPYIFLLATVLLATSKHKRKRENGVNYVQNSC